MQVAFDINELWALIQLAEASVQDDDQLTPLEKRALNKVRRAHAKLYREKCK